MRYHYIPLLFLFSPLLNNAQSAFTNKGATVYVQQQGLIEVQGDFINDSSSTGGAVKNDGTIEITGNFENKPGSTFGVYNNSASTERVVKFVGRGTQTISGSMSTAGQSSFYNLVIDKVSASDSVEMHTPLVVEGSLVFGSGSLTSTYNPYNLYTNNNQKGLFKTYNSTSGEFLLDVQNGNTDALAGYPVLETGGSPTTGFILTSGARGSSSGGLQRKISSATSYVWPVGTASKGFNGVRLNFSSVPGGGSVKAKFCENSSSTDGYVGKLSQYCAGCEGTSSPVDSGYNRFFTSNECHGGSPQWIIFQHTSKNHGYWSFASTNTGYKYDMEVFPNSYCGYIDPVSTWRVLKHEAAYGADPSQDTTDWRPEIESLVSSINDLTTYTKNAGCYTGNGIPGGIYTDFSQFTLGWDNSSNALPVKLLYVSAQAAGKHHITVSWATSVEINNAGFEVMRSTDAVNFTDVGWVPGHDNSTVTQTYTFDDRVPLENVTYYYKLRQVDNNQNVEYSNVVEATLIDNSQSNFTLYPNPTANDFFLTIINPADEIKVMLYDIQGRLVYDNIYTVQQNGSTQTITVSAASVLPTGTYILNATTNGSKYKAKVVLQ